MISSWETKTDFLRSNVIIHFEYELKPIETVIKDNLKEVYYYQPKISKNNY